MTRSGEDTEEEGTADVLGGTGRKVKESPIEAADLAARTGLLLARLFGLALRAGLDAASGLRAARGDGLDLQGILHRLCCGATAPSMIYSVTRLVSQVVLITSRSMSL